MAVTLIAALSVFGRCRTGRAATPPERRRCTLTPMRLFVVLAILTSFLLPACKAEKPPIFRIEQRKEAPIPNVSGLLVHVADIHTGAVKSLTVKDAKGKEIANGGPFTKGDKLRFAHAGRSYDLVVDKIDYHFTSADYVFVYVEPAN